MPGDLSTELFRLARARADSRSPCSVEKKPRGLLLTMLCYRTRLHPHDGAVGDYLVDIHIAVREDAGSPQYRRKLSSDLVAMTSPALTMSSALFFTKRSKRSPLGRFPLQPPLARSLRLLCCPPPR